MGGSVESLVKYARAATGRAGPTCNDHDAIALVRPVDVEAVVRRINELEERLAESFPKTWAGLQAFLDEKYPEDVFSQQKDYGAQIVRLTREVAKLQDLIDDMAVNPRVMEMLERFAGRLAKRIAKKIKELTREVPDEDE